MNCNSEKKIERRLVERMQAIGGECIKMLADQYSGLPDRLCIHHGYFFFVELKSTGKKPRKIQESVHAKLRRAGAEVFVIDSLESVDELVEDIVSRYNAKLANINYFNDEAFSI